MHVESGSEQRWSDHLAPADVRALQDLAAAAQAADGSPPLNDEALLHLDHTPTAAARPRRHLLAGQPVIGYAQLDPADHTAQLVVDPAARRRGLGQRLVQALLETTPDLTAWAFGDLPAAQALATRFGYAPARTLLRMQLDLTSTTSPPTGVAPTGITFRAYRPGVDAEAWVRLNAVVFADHPEQGRMTAADVAAREAAHWFDPAGFFLAERDGELVGYHWTKSHDRTTGEVYVLGVHPDAGGHGLGRALLDVGLDHLRATGHTRVILYVEGEQTRVVRLYRSAGFTTTARDVIYARPSATPDHHAGAGWT